MSRHKHLLNPRNANVNVDCTPDHSGGDQVVRGVHQDAAHRVRGVRTLPEAPVPAALQRPDQVSRRATRADDDDDDDG